MNDLIEKQHILKRIIGFGLIIDLLILDQLSKWWVLEKIFRPQLEQEPLALGEFLTSKELVPFVQTEITSFFNLTMVWNHGISFGLFQSGNPWPLIVIASIIAIIFSFWLARTKSWVETICLSMVIGGAIGNIIDRLHFGAVADFLDFHAFGWHYPAFNLADSFISLGIVILVMNSLLFERNK